MRNLLAGRRVLVVEDEMMVLMNIEGALAELGCTAVSVASTPEDALALVEAEGFDVAMLDVNLGGEPSYRVADALVLRSIPFVFSTGYGEQGIEARFRGQAVLRKPYSDEQLADALVRLLPDQAIPASA